MFIKKIGEAVKKAASNVKNAVKKAVKNLASKIKNSGSKISSDPIKTTADLKELSESSRILVVQNVVKNLNSLFENLDFSKTLIKENSKEKLSEISPEKFREMMLNGVKINMEKSKLRCEGKFGVGNCVKKGKFSYVYGCNKGKIPVSIEEKNGFFKCELYSKEKNTKVVLLLVKLKESIMQARSFVLSSGRFSTLNLKKKLIII